VDISYKISRSIPLAWTNITRLDIFFFLNLVLFLWMSALFYFDRFVMFHGKANIHEFFIYAAAIFIVICCVWFNFRRLYVDIYILVLLEVAILIHFAGGFVVIDDARLYDYRFFGVRYDKYVHMLNSIIGVFVALYLFRKNGYRIGKFICLITVLSVLGVGAIIEILEFVVAMTVDNNGVGTYINNMLDLAANLLGATIATFAYFVISSRKR
jgi:hypothetical protein